MNGAGMYSFYRYPIFLWQSFLATSDNVLTAIDLSMANLYFKMHECFQMLRSKQKGRYGYYISGKKSDLYI